MVEITAVRTIDVRSMRGGGWGYRGSVRLFGRAAWVLRASEGLEIHLAAAVANGLRERVGG